MSLHHEVKVYSTDLIIVYDYGGDLIQLSQSTISDLPFKFAFLDKEMNAYNSEVMMEFEKPEILEGIIQDFKEKFKQFKNKE